MNSPEFANRALFVKLDLAAGASHLLYLSRDLGTSA